MGAEVNNAHNQVSHAQLSFNFHADFLQASSVWQVGTENFNHTSNTLNETKVHETLGLRRSNNEDLSPDG